jgi:general secretion pathway protein I
MTGASDHRGAGVPGPGRSIARPRPGRGFTLLEVMVALAVLALALTAASDVVGGALRNHVRARQLEVATMLARGRLAEAEAKFEEEGFRDFDQTEEGTFEDDGHPEVTWKVEAIKPQLELGPDAVLKALTGVEGGVAGLLGIDAKGQGKGAVAGSGAGGPVTSLAGSPLAGAAVGMIQQQLTALGEKLKSGVREVRLTVGWKDGKTTESFALVTHLVVLTPGAQKRANPQATGVTPTGAPPPNPPPPGGGQFQ